LNKPALKSGPTNSQLVDNREMKMKVVFEFTDEERSQAEDAFRGTEYKIALHQTRELIRGTLKYQQLTKPQREIILEFQKQFQEVVSDLPLD
jgi:hypothetical protein